MREVSKMVRTEARTQFIRVRKRGVSQMVSELVFAEILVSVLEMSLKMVSELVFQARRQFFFV